MSSLRELIADRYELLEVVGRGGMGVVYRGRDHVLRRPVAVKVLPADRAEDPVFVARFQREARAAAALSHPSIVAVFDSGRHEDTYFIVMEYVAGQDLAQVVRAEGPLPARRAVVLAARVAGALAVAHGAGIIHRDIKPANVMVDDGGGVKVLDFGIARAQATTSLTQTAAVLGSAPYLAPELARGEPADERSDIYSLGCVLYELLTGRPPFTGELAPAILHQHATAEPTPPQVRNPDTPPELDALVLGMLAKHPGDRPQSARELERELEALERGRTAEGWQTAPTRRLPAAPTRRTNRRLAAALSLLALAALLIGLLASSGGAPRGTAGRPRASTRTGVTTSTHRSVSSPATSSTTSPTRPATPSPPTVAGAAGALSNLLATDLQSGAIDHHGQDLPHHMQDILMSYQQGHVSDALHKVDDLSHHVADLSSHRDIQPPALAALQTAIKNLQSALQRAA